MAECLPAGAAETSVYLLFEARVVDHLEPTPHPSERASNVRKPPGGSLTGSGPLDTQKLAHLMEGGSLRHLLLDFSSATFLGHASSDGIICG
jgi:hypothetical protein